MVEEARGMIGQRWGGGSREGYMRGLGRRGKEERRGTELRGGMRW